MKAVRGPTRTPTEHDMRTIDVKNTGEGWQLLLLVVAVVGGLALL